MVSDKKSNFLPAIILRGSLLVLLAAGAAAAAPQTVPDTTVLQRVPAKASDRCIVCDKPLEQGGIVILYRGRRVPVYNREMLKEFLHEPVKYFAKLQARGALFNEDAVLGSGIHPGWLFFGVWSLIAFIAAALSANIALRKGVPATRWFFIGLGASVIGLLLAMKIRPARETSLPPGLAKIPATPAPQACPKCRAMNHPAATVCSVCGETLQPATASEASKV